MQHHLLNFWYDSQAIDQCQQVLSVRLLTGSPVFKYFFVCAVHVW